MKANPLRKKSIKRCKKLGVSVADHLPPIDGFQPRSAKVVAERIIILHMLIGLAEPEVNAQRIIQWSTQNGIDDFLSVEDKQFLEKAKTGKLTDTNIIDLSWLRESILILGWYTGIVPKLKGPFRDQSFSEYLSKIPPAVDVLAFIENTSVIDQSLLQAELDFFYCLHNGLRTSTRKSSEISTVFEQRRALEWLSSTNDWYETHMDT